MSASYTPEVSFPKTVPEIIATKLRDLGHFVYYPNPGNLGDALIAVATVQVFEQLGLSYETYDEQKDYGNSFNLVYGGGGGMIPEWGALSSIKTLFTTPGLKRCVILPHSLQRCDEILECMDERFTVFCREEQSYAYCTASSCKATILKADDMACHFDISRLPELEPLLSKMPYSNPIFRFLSGIYAAKKSKPYLMYRFYKKTYHRLNRHLRSRIVTLKNGKRVAYFMRQDDEVNPELRATFERITANKVPLCDLSRYGGSNCRWHDYNQLCINRFSHAIKQTDIIVTDRLHVSILGAILGRTVIMLDNSYGKLSGVYEQSLSHLEHIHLCRTAQDLESKLGSVLHN